MIDFLDSLCEEAWFFNDRLEAIQIADLFRGELSAYQKHIIDEIIFGPLEEY